MVEGGGLENRCPVMSGTGGSNPSPSASISKQLAGGSWQLRDLTPNCNSDEYSVFRLKADS